MDAIDALDMEPVVVRRARYDASGPERVFRLATGTTAEIAEWGPLRAFRVYCSTGEALGEAWPRACGSTPELALARFAESEACDARMIPEGPGIGAFEAYRAREAERVQRERAAREAIEARALAIQHERDGIKSWVDETGLTRGWKREKFNIAVPEGLVERVGVARGLWAIHKEHEEDTDYVLTHRPSGMAIAHGSAKDLRVLAARFHGMPGMAWERRSFSKADLMPSAWLALGYRRTRDPWITLTEAGEWPDDPPVERGQ